MCNRTFARLSNLQTSLGNRSTVNFVLDRKGTNYEIPHLLSLACLSSFGLYRGRSFMALDKSGKQTGQPRATRALNPTNQPNPTQNANGSAKAIPDNVAWELFLRTVGENNARPLVERAGNFAKDEDRSSVDHILEDAKSLYGTLASHDQYARELKNAKNKRPGFRLESDPQLKAELGRVQAWKDQQVAQTVNRFLPGDMSKETWRKMQDFIDTEVKGNIQVVPQSAGPKATSRKPDTDTKSTPAQASAKNSHAPQYGGNIYLYSAGWNDGANVYGTGTLSEQYWSNSSYLAAVTVTSPTGRANTPRPGTLRRRRAPDRGRKIGFR